ncbi:MAG: 30S ribosome-binding factor RbfA [Dysgonamonadaceae bacterium]|jgi:ribosome-binding factor A|nr:30S ribosome-binding factor RbfA [Dysgonamonadaceae bacterium]
MENKRLQKIERLIQKDLGSIFLLQTKASHGLLVSVTKVRVSPDLSVAKAYLSIFPSEKGKEMLDAINRNKRSIRFELGQLEKNQLRKIPELSFFLDDSLDYLEHIDDLLKNTPSQ